MSRQDLSQINNILLIEAALSSIRCEMDRLYWNKNQKEMSSPFDNTGNTYHNDVFTVRAYDWQEREDDADAEPNFEYADLKVYWYKYLGRGTHARCPHEITADFLEKMIKECFEAMREDSALGGWNNG